AARCAPAGMNSPSRGAASLGSSRSITGGWPLSWCVRDGRENACQDPCWTGRTPRYGYIDGEDVRDSPATRVVLAKDAAGATAITKGNHDLRVRCSFIRSTQRHFHVFRYRSRHQEEIGVPGACHESDAEAFEVVEGIIERVDLKLAAVARACIDVTDAEGPTEHSPDVCLQAVANA